MAIGAATIGNARCLKTSYAGNAVVPITCTDGVWGVGSAVTLDGGGSPSSLAISLDGMHSIIACDNSSSVAAVRFNTGAGLWVPNGYVTLPEANLTNIAITPDGLRGICVPKSSSNAYPLFRDPITDVWSEGPAIALGTSTIRYFGASFDPTGAVCLIGSNVAGVDGDVLLWDGSAWTRAAVAQVFAASRWLSDGTSVLTVSGGIGTQEMKVLAYDAGTQAFSLSQTVVVSGLSSQLWGISVPELGRQDIAIAVSFYDNKMVPFTEATGSWSAGTLISSPYFSAPLATVIMPIL